MYAGYHLCTGVRTIKIQLSLHLNPTHTFTPASSSSFPHPPTYPSPKISRHCSPPLFNPARKTGRRHAYGWIVTLAPGYAMSWGLRDRGLNCRDRLHHHGCGHLFFVIVIPIINLQPLVLGIFSLIKAGMAAGCRGV